MVFNAYAIKPENEEIGRKFSNLSYYFEYLHMRISFEKFQVADMISTSQPFIKGQIYYSLQLRICWWQPNRILLPQAENFQDYLRFGVSTTKLPRLRSPTQALTRPRHNIHCFQILGTPTVKLWL